MDPARICIGGMPVKRPACSSAAAAAALAARSPPVRSPSANKPVPWAPRVSAVAGGGEVAGEHFMSGAGCWPALSSGSSVAMMPPAVVAAAPKSEASIAAAAAAPSPPQPTRVASSSTTGNETTERTGHGDRAAPEPHAPAHAPNHRSNGAAARHQRGSFPSHHRSWGAHNAGRGKWIDGGSSIGNGNCITNVNFNCYDDNGGGVRLRHGQGNRGGGHHDGHGQPAGLPQIPPYVTAPHHHPHLHYPFPVLPPPPMPFFAPPMPPSPFCGAYYGPVIGYTQTEFAAAGWHVPPQPDAVHFVPYPALPVHATLPDMEEQPQQQAAPAHAEEPEPVQPSGKELEEKIRRQIEFYFSENNLCEDLYLKEQMDEQGWVPLTLIMGFNKVKEQTTDLQFILQSLASSTEVEVQDGRIRRRVGWGK